MEASIQAGEGNYSTPKKNYTSSDQYETFEVALFLFGEFYHPHYNENFINKSWAKHWSEYDEIGAYVPREEVKAMLSDLRKYWSPK